MSSSSPLSFHIKKPSKSSPNTDDLSLVKAATGTTWYEEFEVLSRNYKKAQEPSSRYKVQVINKEVIDLSQYSSSSSSPNVFIPIKLSSTSNNNNSVSLFDKYEIERISSQLDQYIENTKEKIKSSEKKFKIFKGFLLFRYYKMMMNMCVTSSYDDVVVLERRICSNPQSPEKSSAPVVKFASCQPWRKGV